MWSRPKRRFAQHFLEPAWAERLVRLVDPQPGETIVEIGPGRGALTGGLARSGATVVAVEIDRDLAVQLRAQSLPNLTVICQDFLQLDLDLLPSGAPAGRVVGNLPYSVGSRILVRLLWSSDQGRRFRDAVVMLQREVADRVTARPGSRNWGPLGVVTGLHAEPTRVMTLPPGAFRPMPKVTAAVVALRFRPAPVTLQDPLFFDQMVRAMFTQRRKTAVNALRAFSRRQGCSSPEGLFRQTGIDPKSRPGALGLTELAELSEVLQSVRR